MWSSIFTELVWTHRVHGDDDVGGQGQGFGGGFINKSSLSDLSKFGYNTGKGSDCGWDRKGIFKGLIKENKADFSEWFYQRLNGNLAKQRIIKKKLLV